MEYSKLGVSLYLSNLNNIDYLKTAKAKGVKNLFVSIHTPEDVLQPKYKDNVARIFEIVHALGFENVICDISPISLQALGMSINTISELKKFGIKSLRLDYGFSDEEQIEIAKNFKVSVNASQVTTKQLSKFNNEGLINKIIAFHNFYPLPGSGLSTEQLFEKDLSIREFGIKQIYSFIPGKSKFRLTGNIAEGLVTLEKHRYKNQYESFLEMINKYHHSVVFIADPDFFSFNENEDISVSAEIEQGYLNKNEIYETRESDAFIRLRGTRSNFPSESGKPNLKFSEIKPTKSEVISRGDIVICNSYATRYLGEIFVVKKTLTADQSKFVNKIGFCKLSEGQISLIERKGQIKFI